MTSTTQLITEKVKKMGERIRVLEELVLEMKRDIAPFQEELSARIKDEARKEKRAARKQAVDKEGR